MKQIVEDRFWAKVHKTDICWEWTAAIKDDGYGAYTVAGDRSYRAHQFSYILAHGAIPTGKELNHLCANKTCVRPDHLEALTHSEHMRKTPGTFGYTWAQRTHCEKGHELKGDNLLASHLKRGARRCRICDAEKQRAYRRAHPEVQQTANRKYREKNHEKLLARNRWYNEHVRGHKPRTPRDYVETAV